MGTSAIAMVTWGTSGCVSPAFTADHYQQQALQSVAASESELQTTRIALESMINHRIFATTADELVSGSEGALGSVASAFRAVQPPNGSSDVQSLTLHYVSSAEDAVTQARIAVRRSDSPALRLALVRVQRLLTHGDAVSERLT